MGKSSCRSHRLYHLTLGCYIFFCNLARLSASRKHVLFGPNGVRGTLREQLLGSAANTSFSQIYIQQHSNAYAFSGGLRGGSVQSAYMPVAATLFGHVCTVDLIDLVPCLCCTSAAQLAMTSILGWVVLQCLRSRGALLAQSDLSSLLHHINDLVCGGWSIGTRPAESAVSL
eukprot:TRINITY_DN30115_c0_g1_i1.p1 TRINITY_DN30115_c0_g1~~TRINITY_DN30115_c0_g1_i1.p1  ORF type:complete len:172 (-),score=20.87 TRINITY_DN30115_c0_g1_i1:120-635(-)